MGLPGVALLRSERPHDRIRVAVDDGQQHAGGPVGNATALFSLLQGPYIETETIRELPPAQLQALAQGDDPVSDGVVHDPAGKHHLAAYMGKHFPVSIDIEADGPVPRLNSIAEPRCGRLHR